MHTLIKHLNSLFSKRRKFCVLTIYVLVYYTHSRDNIFAVFPLILRLLSDWSLSFFDFIIFTLIACCWLLVYKQGFLISIFHSRSQFSLHSKYSVCFTNWPCTFLSFQLLILLTFLIFLNFAVSVNFRIFLIVTSFPSSPCAT